VGAGRLGREMSVRVAVVGAGYMGSAHARVINRIAEEHPGSVELGYVVDIDYARAKRVAARYGAKPLSDVKELGSVDLAIIAVPTKYHFKVFEQLVEQGVAGFLVEKPMTSSLEEAAKMLDIAEKKKLWLTVGHIERFNPAVRELHRRIAQKEIDGILTLVARRVGPFAPRAQNVDVVYDLGVHEIDNALIVYGSLPKTIRSYTLEGLVTKLTDYALIILGYEEGYASIEVNRITAFKQRELYLTTRRGTIYLNYLKQELRIHRGKEEVNVLIDKEEPLYLEDLSAIETYANGKQPLVDGYQGFLALYFCELALMSRMKGSEIDVSSNELYHRFGEVIEKGMESLRGYIKDLKYMNSF
jgi:UDP-N-acetylglucosamine 3-dehydrogenase